MSEITTAQKLFCLSVIAQRNGMGDMAQELLNRSMSSSDMDEFLSISGNSDTGFDQTGQNDDLDDLELVASSILGASLLPTTLAYNDVHLTSTSSTRLKIIV